MILVSGCLLGQNCKYNGDNNYHEAVVDKLADSEIVSVCPERDGGLPIPRPPAEIKSGGGEDVWTGEAKVVTKEETDVTAEFIKGAQAALAQAQKYNCCVAVLKARSPSCGSKEIYDGQFAGQTKAGAGVTTALLNQQGIKVINEEEIDKLDQLKGE